MEVIVSHGGTDFDALAAMVACSKLHPQAVMVLAGSQRPGVRQFIAEHREFLPLHRAEQLDPRKISYLYIVDAQGRRLLGDLAWLCDKADTIVTYDHHPPYDQAGPGIRQQVGAITTILVEQLREKKLPVSPFEATLFLLGIYEDTHCLTSVATTPRDMLAAARLREQGGRLSQVSKYIDIRLAHEQRDLLAALLGEARIEAINQRSVLFMAASLEQFVSGLGALTQRLVELEACDLAVSIVKMENQAHFVARSQRPELNLLEIFAPLNVKGHAGAITMTVKISPAALYARAVELLRQRLPKGQVAGDIMSVPVKTIHEDAPIEEAHRLLLRYGHTGIPVVNSLEAVSGIVSRGDIEKAMRHNLGQAPARNYMTRNVVTVDVLAPINEVTRIIVQNDIGRVPVLERGRLVGIITRTDLLKQIYGAGEAPVDKSLFSARDYRLPKPAANLTGLINSRLPQRLQGILMLLGQIAQQNGFMVYAVGGFVRDLLLGLPNFDLDVAVEDDAINFARKLADSAGGKLAAHDEMGTATLTLADGFQIDFATARTEYYQFPAAMPEVEQTTIKHDLYRRDFTINTLAFALNTERFGEFLDFFGGHADLQAGLIRVLYNLSFVEDPTRILRAIRFACRYGFRLEEDTRVMLDRAVADDMLAKTPAARLGRELRQMFMEPNVPALLKMAWELGALQKLIPGLEWSRELERQIAAAAGISQWQAKQSLVSQSWLLYPLLLLKALPREAGEEDLERLGLRGGREQQLVRQVAEELEGLSSALKAEDLAAGGIYDLLQPQPTLALLALLAANPGEAGLRSRVLLYLEKLADLEIAIDGKDLLRLGVEAGPKMGRILKAVHRARLEGRVLTQEEELALAERLRKEGE